MLTKLEVLNRYRDYLDEAFPPVYIFGVPTGYARVAEAVDYELFVQKFLEFCDAIGIDTDQLL